MSFPVATVFFVSEGLPVLGEDEFAFAESCSNILLASLTLLLGLLLPGDVGLVKGLGLSAGALEEGEVAELSFIFLPFTGEEEEEVLDAGDALDFFKPRLPRRPVAGDDILTTNYSTICKTREHTETYFNKCDCLVLSNRVCKLCLSVAPTVCLLQRVFPTQTQNTF